MSFEGVFGGQPDAMACAPGRVNLLGEHTDYNDGYVMPVAIPQTTCVSLRMRSDAHFRLHSESLRQTVDFAMAEAPAEQFARYVHGCLREAADAGVEVPGLDLLVASTVPMGVGLSSSAALEVATLRALRQLLQAPFDDLQIARMAQRAEVAYAGVRCGIMDQMAASLADTQHALFVDTRTLAHRRVALPADAQLMVVDSGVPRSLAQSGYNERRAQCERAARALGVSALRDVEDPAACAALPDPLARRARHVVTENARVLRALRGVDAVEFGRLMNESHASLRDDYEVSTPQLDVLVGLLQAHPRVHGARLTGAGFGGACVALCEAGSTAFVFDEVLRACRSAGLRGELLVPNGAGRTSPALTSDRSSL